MRTLLRLDASARTLGSHSRALADFFVQRWRELHPDGRVVSRCLASEPIPHLDGATIHAFHGGPPTPGSDLSDRLIAELEGADDILISSPLYNFSFPSSLKAWVDHVVRQGRTFVVDPSGDYRGLLTGRRATVLTARGGRAEAGGQDEFQTPCLRRILQFIGITEVVEVGAAGLALSETSAAQGLREARERLSTMLAPLPPVTWTGEATDADRREIEALRAGQEQAIRTGDADAYARLCADDVRLMLPGHALVAGREQLHACEVELFRVARFPGFRKFPERVECSGDLAVETGRQTVAGGDGANGADVRAARQKYTHVFRRTGQGWRFAVLMSNTCE